MWNRFKNTVSIPYRGICTWLTATADVFDALAAIPKDMRDVVKYTSGEIKNIFKSATTRWKRYQKIWNTLLSPLVAIWTAVEWTLRTVVTPGVNLVSNAYRTGKNVVKNAINSTFWSAFSKKPVSNFKYDELKTANIIKKNKNRLSTRRFGRKIFQNKQWENKKTSTHIDEVKNNYKDIKDQKDITNNSQNFWEKWKKDVTQSKKKIETVNKNVEHRWVDEAKRILSDSSCGKIIIDRLCENHKNFWFIFDNTTSDGSCNKDYTITIWTKMPSWIAALAPFNWKTRNPELQKKHLLLHELSHWAIHSHKQDIPEIQEWLNIIQRYIDERKNIDWKTLSMLSYRSNVYKTSRERAREDFVEMLALRMNWNWNLCKKYLNLLSDEWNKNFRENHWLATITKEHASKLQNVFDSIVHYYENLSK